MILAFIDSTPQVLLNTLVIFLASGTAIALGIRPFLQVLHRREAQWDFILRHALLLQTGGRTITVLTGLMVLLFGYIGHFLTENLIGVIVFGAAGLFPANMYVHYLRSKRLRKLNDQLVAAIQMLASGVRAGLNLTQSMQMIARDGADPVRQEFAHLVNEYEYGVPLDQAMQNSSTRIGSSDYRLLFSALQTHRERGGDLARTLDEIADSIREIQRLEGRVKSLTAQGRATARWLGAMPAVVMAVYFSFDPEGVNRLFSETSGNVMLGIIFVFNIFGFIWIRKIMQVDL